MGGGSIVCVYNRHTYAMKCVMQMRSGVVYVLADIQ